MTKQFTLLQLFSLADGRLSTEMGDVYEMLNHICDEDLMTHHLPVACDYVKEKAPKWYLEIKTKLNTIGVQCPVKSEVTGKPERNHDQFLWFMEYINKHNETYDIPQLKDEFDTSDFGDFMVQNSLLLKRKG